MRFSDAEILNFKNNRTEDLIKFLININDAAIAMGLMGASIPKRVQHIRQTLKEVLDLRRKAEEMQSLQ